MLTLPALDALKEAGSRFIALLTVELLDSAACANWKAPPAPIGYCACCARTPMLAGVVRSRRNKRVTGKQSHDLAAGRSGLCALRPRSKWSTVNRDKASALLTTKFDICTWRFSIKVSD
jgi:hypothetical protein